jgi:hypothetical protein
MLAFRPVQRRSKSIRARSYDAMPSPGDVARVRVQGMELKRPLAICTAGDVSITPAVQAFIDLIRKKLG